MVKMFPESILWVPHGKVCQLEGRGAQHVRGKHVCIFYSKIGRRVCIGVGLDELRAWGKEPGKGLRLGRTQIMETSTAGRVSTKDRKSNREGK